LRAPLLLVALLPALTRGEEGGVAPAAEAPPSLAALLERARAERLAEDPAWLRLGHWRRQLLGGLESEVDGPAFFRAPGGKTDPAAELESTLAGLLAAPPGGDELDDAFCRFPARLVFLSRRLGFDPARLPPRSCPRLEDFLARLSPRGVTLVFSSYYLDNPSSAFGHTLLRLDKTEEARGGKHFELLDYGVNYAATADTSNAILYAVKGLFGLFKGEFTHYAYYYKVREYSEAESRDLWEYDLALSPDEVEMLALHLWELGGTWFDYWYLDENCSYHVLGALEAAAPRLDLLSHVGRLVVLPADTLRALQRNPGLVRAVHYRPSIRSQFRARVAPLPAPAADAVEALAADPEAPIPAGDGEAGAAVLDAAVDLVDLRHFRDLVRGKDPAAALVRQHLLERRSAIPVASPPLEVPVPEDRAPHLGHGSARAGAGGGVSREEGPFAVLDLRLALHDLADPPEGHPDLSQLEFLPARLRFLSGSGRLQVDEVHLVRVVTLNPWDRFDRRPSWKFRVGAATVRDGGCDACLAGVAELGGGVATVGLLGALDLLLTADVALEGAPALSGIEGAGVRVGLGPSALLRARAGRRLSLVGTAGWRWLPLATPGETWTLGAQARLHLGTRLSLALEGRRTPSDADGSAVLLGYF
jgi:hypothetical protein